MLYDFRRKLAQKFNIPFLTGRDKHLVFQSKNKTFINGYITKNSLKEIPQLIFLHIPKTAGSSVNNILKFMTKIENSQYLKIPIVGYTPAIKMVKGWLGAWQSAQNISQDTLNSAKIITGHFPFGIHSNKNANYFTLIRSPIDREISSFNYLYQTAGLSKDDKLEKIAFSSIDNPQTRMIAGLTGMKKIQCDEETFQLALENLNKYFLIFGPTEETDEVLEALITELGWPSFEYFRANNTKIKLITSINNDLKEKLKDYHSFDVKLHEYASKKWKELKHSKYTLKRNSEQNIIIIPRKL